MPCKKIYLAGPDVFFPQARDIGNKKKQLCDSYGFEGLFPLDIDIDLEDGKTGYENALELSIRLERMMDESDLIIANLTPFRGVGMDPGTAFETGYMRAQNKPVLGYTNVALLHEERARKFRSSVTEFKLELDTPETVIEEFGLSENLMIEIAIERSGGRVVRWDSAPQNIQHDLGGFEECLRQAGKVLGNEQ